MSEDRDELAALIYGTEPWTKGPSYEGKTYEWSELDDDDKNNWYPQADAILAAGYSKPRTVTTVEDLDALPHHAMIHTAEGDHMEHVYDQWLIPGVGGAYGSDSVALPVSVLWEPLS
jgi:hypothetical protein